MPTNFWIKCFHCLIIPPRIPRGWIHPGFAIKRIYINYEAEIQNLKKSTPRDVPFWAVPT